MIQKLILIFFCLFSFQSFTQIVTASPCQCQVAPSGDESGEQDTQNILACIQMVGDSGGTVYLTDGNHNSNDLDIYYINEPIELTSNLTLKGDSDSETIVRWVGGVAEYMFGYVISSGRDPIHDVTIRDMIINGRYEQVVGVLFDGRGSDPIERISLRGLTIKRAGGFGVHIKQSKGIYVYDVALLKNGTNSGISEDAETKAHNIYLRDTHRVFFEQVTSTESYSNGVNFSGSSEVLLDQVTANDNGQHGIRFEASGGSEANSYSSNQDGIKIHNCTTQNNDNNGIEVHPEEQVYGNNFCISNSTSTGNGEDDLEFNFIQNYDFDSNSWSNVHMGGISNSENDSLCSQVPQNTSVWPFDRTNVTVSQSCSASHNVQVDLYSNNLLVNNNGTVYLIQDYSKHRIASATIFEACGFEWSNVVPLTGSVFNNLSTGTPIQTLEDCYTTNTTVQGSGSAVYLIKDGEKHGFVSATIFESCGLSWGAIIEVTDTALSAMPTGNPVNSLDDCLNDGDVLKGSSSAVYKYQNGFKRPFTSASAFEACGFDWNDITTASDNFVSDLPTGTPITSGSGC